MDRTPPTLNQLNIISSNLDASIAFYRRLGVDLSEQVLRTATGAHHVNGKNRDTRVELDSPTFAQVWNKGWVGRKDLAGRVVVGFAVATRHEVDRLYGEMTAAGHRGLQPPWDAFWGARYAVVEEPDGLAVGLMSPITDEHRSLPPDV
jgi:catechol 2,3-dioxygenase-like lactoylglutathione lyase family enzyme